MDSRQGIAIALIGILLLNLILLGMGKISEIAFWLILGCIAVVTVIYKKRYKVAQ